MSEISLNFQAGTINATMDAPSAGTSENITNLFAVAPDFPTLVAGQTIKLVLYNPTTGKREIDYLTGYTSGSLNGIVTRGAEDAVRWPPVAQVAGSSLWANSPTITDFVESPDTYAGAYGIVADSTTNNGTALNALLTALTNADEDGWLILPDGPGWIETSVSIVPYGYINIRGPGWYRTALVVTAAEDVMSFYPGSTSVAPASGVHLQDLELHGHTSSPAPGEWNNCLTIINNGTEEGYVTSPDFDAQHFLERVMFRDSTGEGYYRTGPCEDTLLDCYACFGQGVGYWTSYDTEFVACKATGMGTGGWYIPHSDVKLSTCNSYNNQWVPLFTSGQNWAAGALCNYSASGPVNGSLYYAKSALTDYTGNPSTDTTHWGAINRNGNGATCPEWGTGYFIDGTARVDLTGCGADENGGSAFYLRNSSQCNLVPVRASTPNYNNTTDEQGATNPNYYSAYVLDGADNNNIIGTTAAMSECYVIKLINGSIGNTIIISTDGTEAGIFSPDTTSIAGNLIIVNGITYSELDAVCVASISGTYTMPAGYQAYKLTMTAATTVTPPAVAAGKGFVVDFLGAYDWALSGVKWPGGTVPTPTAGSTVDRVTAYSTDGSAYIAAAMLDCET